MIRNFKDLMAAARSQKRARLAVAAAQDEEVLIAVCNAAQEGIVEPVLVGDPAEIRKIAGEHGLEIGGFEIVEAMDLTEAARTAVALVSSGKADYLMKGLIDTSILLKAVLDKEIGLRTDSQLSHVMVYGMAAYPKLLFLTDGGMNIAPSLEEKAKIIRNAVAVARATGIQRIKVACLAAKEKVEPKMQATVDADALQKMGEAGDFGPDVAVQGPLAFDLAISKEACEVKKISGEVAGDADVLLVPTIEMGNGIGKTMTYMAGADSAGIIMGAKVPVVLVSRADSHEAKLYSIALGSLIAAQSK